MFPDYMMRRLSFSAPDFLPENMFLHSHQGASSSVYLQHPRVTFFFGWKHGFSVPRREEAKSQPGWSQSVRGRGFPPWYGGHGLQTNALCASLHLLPTNLLLQGIHSGLILLFFSLTKGKYSVGRKAFILRRTVQCIAALTIPLINSRGLAAGQRLYTTRPGLESPGFFSGLYLNCPLRTERCQGKCSVGQKSSRLERDWRRCCVGQISVTYRPQFPS